MINKTVILLKRLGEWSSKNRFFYFVSSFVLLMVILPLVNNFTSKSLITTTLVSLWIIVGMFSGKTTKHGINLVFLLGSITLTTSWLFYFFPELEWTYILSVVATCLFFGCIVFGSARNLISTDKVSVNLISAAITVYIMIGFLGAMICRALYTLNPNSFDVGAMKKDMATFLYFSFITITTVGYGDVLPKSITAQFVAMYLAIIGQLYLAVVMSIIIGKYLHAKNTNSMNSTNYDQKEVDTNRD